MRSMGAAPRVRMAVGHCTCVMRRSVLYLSVNMRCGHLRGRVTAVGRQLELLFTTQTRHPTAEIDSREAVAGGGSPGGSAVASSRCKNVPCGITRCLAPPLPVVTTGRRWHRWPCLARRLPSSQAQARVGVGEESLFKQHQNVGAGSCSGKSPPVGTLPPSGTVMLCRLDIPTAAAGGTSCAACCGASISARLPPITAAVSKLAAMPTAASDEPLAVLETGPAIVGGQDDLSHGVLLNCGVGESAQSALNGKDAAHRPNRTPHRLA
jgi:hypothetical protein